MAANIGANQSEQVKLDEEFKRLQDKDKAHVAFHIKRNHTLHVDLNFVSLDVFF